MIIILYFPFWLHSHHVICVFRIVVPNLGCPGKVLGVPKIIEMDEFLEVKCYMGFRQICSLHKVPGAKIRLGSTAFEWYFWVFCSFAVSQCPKKTRFVTIAKCKSQNIWRAHSSTKILMTSSKLWTDDFIICHPICIDKKIDQIEQA